MRACAASSAKATRRRRDGEIEDAVGLGEERERVVGDRDAVRPEAGELARNRVPSLGRAGALDRAGERHARRSRR